MENLKVKTEVKTYNGNATVWFTLNSETIGSTNVHYAADDLDVDEDCDYNMNLIKDQLMEDFEKIKEEGQELEQESLNDVINTISIHVSPLVK